MPDSLEVRNKGAKAGGGKVQQFPDSPPFGLCHSAPWQRAIVQKG